MSESLPYLQSERHFHLYESYIKQIVDAWPQAIVFDPKHLSVETLSTRIRVCMTSLRNNQWTTVIQLGKFLQIVDDVTVSTAAVPGKVVCGPYDLVRKQVPLGTPVEAEITQVVPKVNLVDPSPGLILAVLEFHHARLLSEPSKLTTTTDVVALAKDYDVAVQHVEDHYIVL